MNIAVLLFVHLVVSFAKLAGPGGTRGLLAEMVLLKHQLMVLNRPRRRAPNLTTWDRFLLGFCCFFVTPARIAKSAVTVSTASLFKFHDALKKRKYSRLFSARTHPTHKPGPKGPSQALIDAIVEMKRRNPGYGCRRIAQQLAKAFGVEVDKDVVRRVLAKYYQSEGGGEGPSWLTIIGHMKDSLWSVDLFRCESILLKTHWVMLVMDQYSRRIIGFGVNVGDMDGIAICRMFSEAITGMGTPVHLSSDNDPLFLFRQWKASLRVLEINEIKSVPYVPMSHPFVERLIGTIRREYFDQVFFWNAVDLGRKLGEFRSYYNLHRTHTAHEGATPAQKAGNTTANPIALDNFSWQQHCHGLFQLPVAA